MHIPPMAKRVSLICVSAARGDGSPENPARTVYLYFSDSGQLMACYDPINGPPDWFEPLPPGCSMDSLLESRERQARMLFGEQGIQTV